MHSKNASRKFFRNKSYVIYIGVGICILSILFALRYSDHFHTWKKNVIKGFHTIAVRNGFGVTEISVKGRVNTPKQDLLKGINIQKNQSIFSLNIERIRYDLEKLGWIHRATIQRHFPNSIFIAIKEEVPIAIWQMDGKLYLIDRKGGIISSENIEKFSYLKVLVGQSANTRAVEFLRLIAQDPLLAKLTSAGILLSNRRWNIVLSGRITVKLPAKNPAQAWIKLAQYTKQKQLLTKPLKSIDMRIPGKILLRFDNSKTERHI